MNIGNILYLKAIESTPYSVEALKGIDGTARKYVINKLDVNTLNNHYGFDDAKEDFILKVTRPRTLGALKEIVVFEGLSYGIVDLPCVHYDDGHDGVFGAFSSPSVNRNFTVNLAFDLRDVTTTKPADFDEVKDNTTTSDKVNKPATGSGTQSTGDGDTPTQKKTNTVLYVAVALFLGFIGWVIFRKKA